MAQLDAFPWWMESGHKFGMPPTERLTIHIRVSPSLLKRIKIAAAENGRSMNAEIVARLERSFGPDDKNRTEALKLLKEVLSLLDKGKP